MSDGKVWVMVETISQYRMRYMVEAPADHPEYAQIGRASCRERVEISGVAGSLKKKKCEEVRVETCSDKEYRRLSSCMMETDETYMYNEP